MKKKSLALLVMGGASAGFAAAQSSVALYGTVDLSAKYVKNEGSRRRVSLAQDGLNRSQLGFRGTEDLGAGLKASFLLLSTIQPDTGSTPPKFFNRRSTVSLSGAFGEIRLGRDFVPTFWNAPVFDVFGSVGVGDPYNIARNFQGLTVPGAAGGGVAAVNTFVRADNAIGYFLPPNLGGIYGQAMAAAGEGGAAGGSNLGRYLGARVGYAAGPLDVAGAYGRTRAALAGEPQVTIWNVGASYNLGVVKAFAQFHHEVNEVPVIDVRERRFVVGASVPIGAGELRASWARSSGDPGPTANQFAFGGVYNLSKRTALYGTAAFIRNKGDATTGANFSVAQGTSSTDFPTRGENSKGAEVGVRHFF